MIGLRHKNIFILMKKICKNNNEDLNKIKILEKFKHKIKF